MGTIYYFTKKVTTINNFIQNLKMERISNFNRIGSADIFLFIDIFNNEKLVYSKSVR